MDAYGSAPAATASSARRSATSSVLAMLLRRAMLPDKKETSEKTATQRRDVKSPLVTGRSTDADWLCFIVLRHRRTRKRINQVLYDVCPRGMPRFSALHNEGVRVQASKTVAGEREPDAHLVPSQRIEPL